MRRWWRSHSVRVRLTLWYVAAMVVVLAVYAAVVFAFVNRSLSETLNTRLLSDFQWASAMVEQTPQGGITWYAAPARSRARRCTADPRRHSSGRCRRRRSRSRPG